MGPVSFGLVGCSSRSEAMALARALVAAGIRVQAVQDAAVLVRAEDVERARDIAADRPGEPDEAHNPGADDLS